MYKTRFALGKRSLINEWGIHSAMDRHKLMIEILQLSDNAMRVVILLLEHGSRLSKQFQISKANNDKLDVLITNGTVTVRKMMEKTSINV